MARRSATLRMIGFVAIFVLASCDQARDNESPFAPSGPYTNGSGQNSGPQDGSSEAKDVKLITEETAPGEVGVSQLIGFNGGSISLLGHTLTVEPGTVTSPTLFTLVAPSTAEVDVLATATVTDVLGNVVDVGALGFARPVTLTLSYYRGDNVKDPKRLVIVYFNPNGKLEVLNSKVDYKRYTVSARLQHFSKYGMATN